MFDWLEQAAGVLVIALVLLDVFFTVLYARTGASVMSGHVAEMVRRVFHFTSRAFGRHRGTVMSFCGPAVVVLLVAIWDFGLTLGAALVIHPALGTSVTSSSGTTPTDFLTALQAGGNATSIVGSGDFSPETGPFRLFYIFASLSGTAVVSLTLSYLMQIYSALRNRNSTALHFHLASAETGDAAELVAGLGPQGKFDSGHSNLSELAVKMTEAKEGHHFYPVLFYFRFDEPHYAVSRFTLVALDSVTLIKSALDDKEHEWLKESASVSHLWRASVLSLTNLTENFAPGDTNEKQPDAQIRERWQRRYRAAIQRLRQAGIETIADEAAGFEVYVSLRVKWDSHIAAIAPLMAYEMEEVDPAGTHPEFAAERKDFRTRAHAAG